MRHIQDISIQTQNLQPVLSPLPQAFCERPVCFCCSLLLQTPTVAHPRPQMLLGLVTHSWPALSFRHLHALTTSYGLPPTPRPPIWTSSAVLTPAHTCSGFYCHCNGQKLWRGPVKHHPSPLPSLAEKRQLTIHPLPQTEHS